MVPNRATHHIYSKTRVSNLDLCIWVWRRQQRCHIPLTDDNFNSVNSVVAFLPTKNVVVGRNFHPSAWCVYVVVAVKDGTQGT